uniref:Uncharacterized protein n=1 Tax=Arundo donax TaxID=35708 RepID=A0A0A9FZZ8_ARUDO
MMGMWSNCHGFGHNSRLHEKDKRGIRIDTAIKELMMKTKHRN